MHDVSYIGRRAGKDRDSETPRQRRGGELGRERKTCRKGQCRPGQARCGWQDSAGRSVRGGMSKEAETGWRQRRDTAGEETLRPKCSELNRRFPRNRPENARCRWEGWTIGGVINPKLILAGFYTKIIFAAVDDLYNVTSIRVLFGMKIVSSMSAKPIG